MTTTSVMNQEYNPHSCRVRTRDRHDESPTTRSRGLQSERTSRRKGPGQVPTTRTEEQKILRKERVQKDRQSKGTREGTHRHLLWFRSSFERDVRW